MESRDHAVKTLTERDTRLRALLATLPPDAMTAPATMGGGDWSAKDVLAHIACWEEMALRALDSLRGGEIPERIDVEEVNAANQERSAGQTLEAVWERYDAAHGRLVGEIQAMGDAEWQQKHRRGDTEFALGEALGGRTGADNHWFDHLDAHLPDVEAYVASRRASS